MAKGIGPPGLTPFVTYSFERPLAYSVSAGFGTVSFTYADDTLSATAQNAVKGTSATTDNDDTLAATGALKAQATSSYTEDSDTLSSNANLAFNGSQYTETNDTLVSASTLLASAQFSIADDSDSLAGVGIAPHYATVTLTDAYDLFNLNGFILNTGQYNLMDSNDTLFTTTINPGRGYVTYNEPDEDARFVGIDPNKVHPISELYRLGAGWKRLFWNRQHVKDKSFRY